MSSKRLSDIRSAIALLDRLTEDLPTTPEDVAALRRVRDRRPGGSLEDMSRLAPPSWLPRAPRRRTAEGWEPFEL